MKPTPTPLLSSRGGGVTQSTLLFWLQCWLEVRRPQLHLSWGSPKFCWIYGERVMCLLEGSLSLCLITLWPLLPTHKELLSKNSSEWLNKPWVSLWTSKLEDPFLEVFLLSSQHSEINLTYLFISCLSENLSCLDCCYRPWTVPGSINIVWINEWMITWRDNMKRDFGVGQSGWTLTATCHPCDQSIFPLRLFPLLWNKGEIRTTLRLLKDKKN